MVEAAVLFVGRLVADGSIDPASRQLGEIVSSGIFFMIIAVSRQRLLSWSFAFSCALPAATSMSRATQERRVAHLENAVAIWPALGGPLFWLFRDPPLTRLDPPRACALFSCISPPPLLSKEFAIVYGQMELYGKNAITKYI